MVLGPAGDGSGVRESGEAGLGVALGQDAAQNGHGLGAGDGGLGVGPQAAVTGLAALHDALGILTGLRVRAGNDANCAALGEFWMGGGSGCRSAIFVTLGTGIGGGVILDGKVLSGAHGVQLAEVVRECWPHGLADVRTLREGADFFEDTAMYLLKEDSHKGKGARRYSTSRNLTPPAEPVRLRLGEEEEAEVPPGVKIIEHVQNANEFGRYEVMVGRIYNQAAFDAWWQIQRRRAAPDPWERLRRRRQRKV